METFGLAPQTPFEKFAFVAALALVVFFALRKSSVPIFEFLVNDFQIWFSESQLRGIFKPAFNAGDLPQPVAEDPLAAYADDEAFTHLRAGFIADLAATSPGPAADQLPAAENGQEPKPPGDPLKEFFAWVPEHLVRLRGSHQKISRGPSSALSQETIHEFWSRMGELKKRASLPELLPVRQMAAALEGMIKQMGERAQDVTISTQRTLAGGMDLLKELCAGVQNVERLTNSPFRMLVVDDDPICRVAVTYALKKAFDQPDLAEDGPSALALATREAYDVIFLDVQMPGMDGFELCSKIHETSVNPVTPVVFVTSMNDFNARAKSSVSGGSEVIGKPFLSFEIAVKALTLSLRHRLGSDARIAKASQEALPTQKPAVNGGVAAAASVPAQVLKVEPPGGAGQSPSGPVVNQVAEPSPKDGLAALCAQASSTLSRLQEQLQKVGQTTEEPTRWKALAKSYIEIQSLARALAQSELHPAFQLCSALAGLFQKLQKNPKNATPTTLGTLSASVDLLGDLCARGISADLGAKPAMSILVVDDDPLTRRAITGALQVAFLRPDNAESGEAALALAAEKSFDVIFMDVQMPGMDGFTACSRIHDTAPNLATPVIFVTSHTDAKSRAQSTLCGGSDFIIKPFSSVEITVLALTYALRARLNRANNSGQNATGENVSPVRQKSQPNASRPEVNQKQSDVAVV
jgi:CheY-like chemotaxis protein